MKRLFLLLVPIFCFSLGVCFKREFLCLGEKIGGNNINLEVEYAESDLGYILEVRNGDNILYKNNGVVVGVALTKDSLKYLKSE